LRTLERTPLRRLQLRFAEPELKHQFLLSYRAAARPWIRMSLLIMMVLTAPRFALRRGRDHRHTGRRRSRRCGERGRHGWSFHERSPADAGDLSGDGGLLKTAS
jgi:hypothetical protein